MKPKIFIFNAQKRQNLKRFLRLLAAVVEKAPNLVKLQIPCVPELMAERGVAKRILDQVAKMNQLQSLEIPQFHCCARDLTEIARKVPKLGYQKSSKVLTFFSLKCLQPFARHD